MSSVSTQTYRLTLRGAPVGSHVFKQQTRGRTTLLEAKLQLQGGLGHGSIVQMSRCHRDRFFSFAFREVTEGRSETRTFDVAFDADSGVVTARRGARDEAAIPYLRPLRDPLSLLHELRHLPPETEHHRMPMLGKDVVATLVGRVEIDTVLGARSSRAYRLHPGGSFVYVDEAPPHAILRLTQRLDEHLVDAVLIRIAEEGTMRPWNDSAKGRGGERRGQGGEQGGGQGGGRGGRGSGKRQRRNRRRRRNRNRKS